VRKSEEGREKRERGDSLLPPRSSLPISEGEFFSNGRNLGLKKAGA
jgi:hypothetical protein